MAASSIQRISSLYTGIMKLLPVPLLCFSTMIIVLSFTDHSLTLLPNGLPALGFTLVALALFTWESIRLKFVFVDDHKLYVAGWFKKRAIPLGNIERVYYGFGVGLVFVDFKSPTAFGRRIVFMATTGDRFRALLRSPSVVEELQRLVAAYKPSDEVEGSRG